MKAAVFDVDGTLTDSVHLHAKAWEEAFRHFGYSIPYHKIRSQMGNTGHRLLPAFLSRRELESIGKEIEGYRQDLFRRNFLSRIRPFAKVRELFQRLLEDDWKIVLAAPVTDEDLAAYIKVCRISDLLSTQPWPSIVPESRSHPDILLTAINRLGRISPEDCIIVGASQHAAKVAQNLKAHSVGFLCGGFDEEDLSHAGFDTLYWGAPDLYVKYGDSIFCREFRDARKPDHGHGEHHTSSSYATVV